MDELKKCPFCGGSVTKDRKRVDSMCEGTLLYVECRFRVRCNHCGCKTDWLFYDEDAERIWNRRVNER